jgi:hypothetical protein
MEAVIVALFVAGSAFLPRAGDLNVHLDRAASTRPEFAGTFFWANGFESEILEIHPSGRFDLHYDCCTGGYHTSGGATLVDGHLDLNTDLIYVFLGAAAQRKLIPTRWGTRLYLVPSEHGRTFCDHVNLVGSSGHPGGVFFIRAGDEEKKVIGLPDVPKEWRNMLLDRPLEGKIIAVMNPGRARVDFGSQQGVWKSMSIWANCDGSSWEEVVAVEATTCVIESNHPATVFKVGNRVSSRRPARTAP